jgi:hypothetical protein
VIHDPQLEQQHCLAFSLALAVLLQQFELLKVMPHALVRLHGECGDEPLRIP